MLIGNIVFFPLQLIEQFELIPMVTILFLRSKVLVQEEIIHIKLVLDLLVEILVSICIEP